MECCYEKVKQGFRECADPFCRHTAISHSNKQKGSAAMKLSEDLENVAAVGDNMLATICSSPKVREEAIVAMTMVLQSKLYALQGDDDTAKVQLGTAVLKLENIWPHDVGTKWCLVEKFCERIVNLGESFDENDEDEVKFIGDEILAGRGGVRQLVIEYIEARYPDVAAPFIAKFKKKAAEEEAIRAKQEKEAMEKAKKERDDKFNMRAGVLYLISTFLFAILCYGYTHSFCGFDWEVILGMTFVVGFLAGIADIFMAWIAFNDYGFMIGICYILLDILLRCAIPYGISFAIEKIEERNRRQR